MAETEQGIRPEDFAYMAGFVDGEGCFHSSTNGYPLLNVGQINPRPLLLFSSFSGSEIRLIRQNVSTNTRHMHCITIGARPVLLDLCNRLFPYLRIKDKHTGAILRCDITDKEERRLLARQLSEWNRTGIGAPTLTTCPPETALTWREWDTKMCAYHAGLFDGEGCIHGTQRPSRQTVSLTIAVAMVEPAAVGEVARAFGKSLCHGKSSSGRNMRPSFRVELTGYAGYIYLSLIRPYLRVKDTAADIYLDWFDGDVFQKRHAIDLLRACNHKGARDGTYQKNQGYYVPISSVAPQTLERIGTLY